MEDKPENLADKLPTIYQKSQLNTLNELEGIHHRQPDKAALVISLSLSIIEAAVAFYLLAEAGILIAGMVSLFPVVLLWAIANHHADRVEIPEAYDKLVEKYYASVKK